MVERQKSPPTCKLLPSVSEEAVISLVYRGECFSELPRGSLDFFRLPWARQAESEFNHFHPSSDSRWKGHKGQGKSSFFIRFSPFMPSVETPSCGCFEAREKVRASPSR